VSIHSLRREDIILEDKISVIIITKNEGNVIETCLISIFNQSVKPYEVIVVDGRSTDDTLEKVRKFPAKIIIEKGDTSPSNARNLGVQNANGNIVLIMGADAELNQDCIKYAIEYFKDPKVIVVIPTLEIRIHTRLEKIQKAWFWGSRSRLRTPYGTGSSIQFVRKDIYLKIKFDTSIGYGDDSDFSRRMLKLYQNKMKIIRSKESKVLVDLPHTYSEIASQFKWYGRTSIKYYTKYHNVGALIRLGNVLLPTILIISLLITFMHLSYSYISYIIFILIIVRYIIICIRSKTAYLIDFLIYDFYRSLFYVYGIFQGIFVKKIGR